MKTTTKILFGSMLCGCLCFGTANGQTMIEGFEYANDIDLLFAWTPGGSTITLSDYVAPGSDGTNSMRVERYFPASVWDTEVITGTTLGTPVSVAPDQYITIRIAGDPQFTNASYQTLFIYAYDANLNFGRWGSPVPTDGTNWQVFNFLASSITQPWDSPGLPDLSNLTQFKFYLYGQGDPPGTEFAATIYVDDLMIRDEPLIEFPPPSAMRSLIDDFEGYADTAALLGFYGYVNSPAATVSTAALETPAPQGSQALKLGIDFAPGQYPWGSVRSAVVDPFSFPTNGMVQFQLKGDPTLASVADAGTTFWLSFYDQAGRGFNFSTASAPVISGDWTTLTASYNQFWSTTPVDTGNLVRWRILVEGWEGSPASTAMSGTFYVDNIRVVVPPVLTVLSDSGTLSLLMENLMPGTTYTLRQTEDFSSWTTSTIEATAESETWTIPAGQKGFYQLYYTP